MQLEIRRENFLDHQWEFLRSKAMILALVCGFGAGKTHVFIRKVLYHHLFSKNQKGLSNGWIIYPTLSLANELFIDDFKELLKRLRIKYKHNIQNGRIVTRYGVIKIYTLEKPDNMIGANLTYCGIDEFDTVNQKKALKGYNRALGRLRGCDNPQLFIVTTPEGFKATYHIFVENQRDTQKIIHAKTTDNPFLPESYTQMLRDQYPEKLLKAYLEGQFVNLTSGNVYYAFNREKHVRQEDHILDKNLPVNICFDFNVYPYSVSLCQIVRDDDIRFFGEWVSKAYSNTYEACDALTQMLPSDIDVVIYGDASGKNGAANSTVSNYQIIDEKLQPYFKSINYLVPHSNPPVKDRINCFNSKLGKNHITFNKSCVKLIQDLEQVIWNEKMSEIDKSNIHRTHSSDGAGYFIYVEFPIMNLREPSTTKMYNRL